MISMKTNTIALISGLLLILYSSFLVISNYQSQIHLQKISSEQLIMNLQKRALVAGYFFSERKNDLKALSEKRLFSIFFENQAIGMSLEYGARTSLNNISQELESYLKKKQINGQNIYSRIVFINRKGRLLADTDSENKEYKDEQEWKKLQNITMDEVLVTGIHEQEFWRIIVSAPYIFKGKYEGHILAWINRNVFIDNFLSVPPNEQDHSLHFISHIDGHLHSALEVQDSHSLFTQHRLKDIKINSLNSFSAVNAVGLPQDVLAFNTAIEGTPFFLTHIIEESILLGKKSPRYLVLAMGLLAIAFLTILSILWRINVRNLILATTINETSKRKELINEKNRRLSKEITERQQVETKLQKFADKQTVLLQEVNHRVSNNLTAIVGMLQMEVRRSKEEGLLECMARLNEVAGRINILFTVHKLLSAAQWNPLSLKSLCESLLAESLLACPSDQVTTDFEFSSSNIYVDSTQSHYLAIILNELITNSLKYALQGRAKVHIKISAYQNERSIYFIYHDNGPGYNEAILRREFPKNRIGFHLISGVVKGSLQGKIELLNDEGAMVRVIFPEMIDCSDIRGENS